MSKKARQLGFRLLAVAALAALTVPAAQAELAQTIRPGYTVSAVGGTSEQACENAIARIKDSCDFFGQITTDPGRCWPLWDLNGEVIGYACTCEAHTPFCARLVAFPF